MAGKLTIEIYKEKNASDLTAAIAAPECKANGGSAAAYTAALGCALLERVARICAGADNTNERLAYLVRNSEILRTYMVHLIDEDVKAKGPINRARKEGGEREIEASIQTASCIDAEIVNMMKNALEFALELSACCPAEDRHFLLESAELCMASCRAAQSALFAYADLSTDETYRFVTHRENEIFLEERQALYDQIVGVIRG